MPSPRRRLLTARYRSVDELEQWLDPSQACLLLPLQPPPAEDGESVSVEIRLPPEEDRVVVRGDLYRTDDDGACLVMEPGELELLRTRIAIGRGERTDTSARVTRFGVDEVQVVVRSGTHVLLGFVADVSTGGCFIVVDSEWLPELDSELVIELPRGLLRPRSLRARVAWKKAGDRFHFRGFGCSFLPGQDQDIGKFVSEVLSR